ncbi:MAG: BadF/BadG/BcrA/BcrD ATPase family protein [Acidobacteriia bacterium]|nr:BadF/BadG/BcrA/BcrD ATPase family protein [Terriglobia bacterium]
MKILIGIDGGGTKTEAAAATEDGRILGTFEAGPSNVFKVDAAASAAALESVIEGCLKKAGADKKNVAALCAGLAGVDRPTIQQQTIEVLSRIVPIQEISVVGDATTALVGATDGEPGMVVISGTGSIAYGMNTQHLRARAGGWGHIVDDFGSGYDIVRNAFNEVFRAHDGLEPPTRLRQAFLDVLEVDTVDNLLIAIHRDYTSASKVASLFPKVQEVADGGDIIANKILERAGHNLSSIAEAVVRKLDLHNQTFICATAGGVFQSSHQVRDSFAWYVHRYAPHANVCFPKKSAVEGAIMLARLTLQGKSFF